MEILNKAAEQLRELFASMTPGARVTAGLLLAVVLVSLAYLFRQGTSGPDVYLFGAERLSARDLDHIQAAIASRNLTGAVREGNRIRVPAGKEAEYWAAVADADAMPRNFHDQLDKAVNTDGPFDNRETTKQRFRIAKANTLGEIIRAMPWVDDAVVLYDEQSGGAWSRPRQVTASVSVMPVPGEPLDYQREKRLRRLVAHSVLGLTAENVAVTNLGNDSLHSGGGFSPEAFENEFLRERAKFIEQQRTVIKSLLDYIPGVRVQVNAELENTVEDVTRNIKPEEKTAIVHELSSKEKSALTVAQNGGPPGLTTQGPTPPQNELTPRTDADTTESSNTEVQSFAGWIDQHTKKTGFVPGRVEATIAVPNDYVVRMWRQQYPTPPGQTPRQPEQADLENIELHVRTEVENLVERVLPGHVEGEDTFKYVTVEFVETIAPPPIPEPSLADTALAWTGRNWSTLTMAGIAMFSMLVLRSIAKAPPRDSGTALPGLTLDLDEEADDVEDQKESAAQRLRLKKGPSLKDDLAEMVKEDPDSAATILRAWISKAA